MSNPIDAVNFYRRIPERRTLGLILGPLVMVALMLLPLPGDLSPEGKRLAAVIALMAIWWITEAIPIPVTALIPLVFFPLFGIQSSGQVAPNYANHLIFLFVGGFLLASAMEKWDLHKRIALCVLFVTGTRPKNMVLGFMLATAILAMWVSNTATAMMLVPVGMAVVRNVSAGSSYGGKTGEDIEEKVRSEFGCLVMLGIAYGSSLGGIGTLIGTPPNIVMAGFIKKLFPLAPEISFFKWSLAAVPFIVVFLPIAWWVLCHLTGGFKLKQLQFASGNREVIRQALRKLGPASTAEKRVALVFSLTVFLWIFRSPIELGILTIPGWSQVFSHGNYFHDATVAMLAGVSLFLIPSGSGEPLLDWETAKEKIPWGIVFLFGGGFALASGFGATGLDHWIGGGLASLSALPVLLLIFFLVLMVIHLTEITSNTASATMLMPILASLAVSMGKNPLMLMIPATLACSMAFMLPVATPPNAIVFGSGWVSISRMARVGFVLNLTATFLLTMLGYFWMMFVFGVAPDVLPEWAG